MQELDVLVSKSLKFGPNSFLTVELNCHCLPWDGHCFGLMGYSTAQSPQIEQLYPRDPAHTSLDVHETNAVSL